MTLHAWPLDGKQFTAADMRQWLAGLLEQDGVDDTLGPVRARGGVRRSLYPTGGNGSPLRVQAQATPNMTVKVNPGTAWIPASSGLGVYEFTNDAVTNVTIAPAHATLSRIDLVVAQITDNGDNTSTYGLNAIQGTAAGTPSAPAVPTNSLVLAQIAVGAAVTSITSGNITDQRVYTAALGGRPYLASPALAVETVDTTGNFCTVGQIAWTSTFGGGSGMSLSFVAPPSGQVLVVVSAGMTNNQVHLTGGLNFYKTRLNVQITGPAGYSRAPVDAESAFTVGSVPYAEASSEFLVSSLTAGSTYTATLQGSTLDGTGSYLDRKLLVKPVAT